VQLYRYSVSQSNEFCRYKPFCCFSTSVYYCRCLFSYDSVRKRLDTPPYPELPPRQIVIITASGSHLASYTMGTRDKANGAWSSPPPSIDMLLRYGFYVQWHLLEVTYKATSSYDGSVVHLIILRHLINCWDSMVHWQMLAAGIKEHHGNSVRIGCLVLQPVERDSDGSSLSQTARLIWLLTTWLTLWGRDLLEKLIVTQLVKKFPAFYGTWRFITVFTRARHWSLSWARWIQSTHSHPTSLRSILILSPPLCLGLPRGLFPSGSPSRTLHVFHISPMRATYPAPSHPPWFDHPNNTWWGVGQSGRGVKMTAYGG
jgi:hypothetical protein